MTKEERSAKAKESAFKRQLNKINPVVVRRIQNDYAAAVQDNFEKRYSVGKYATSKAVDTSAPSFPDKVDFDRHFDNLRQLLKDGINTTTNEDRRLEFNLATLYLFKVIRHVTNATHK